MPETRTLRLEIEYDGTEFHGWQDQVGVRTVQGELRGAWERITGERAVIQGAGRTDAGVHASGQVASVRTLRDADYALVRGLNAVTGWDLSVKRISVAPPGFCARRDANGKMYVYRIFNGREASPLKRRTHLHVRRPLDAGAMNDAAGRLVGVHDFSAFRAADCDRADPTVTMWRLDVARDGDVIEIVAVAPAFLKNMVRIVAGTLFWVGYGRLRPEQVGEILASRDRSVAGPTVPPHGLELVRVYYGRRGEPPQDEAITSSIV